MQLRTILCPVDFSGGSRAALQFAADLASHTGAGLALVHVWEPPRWLTGAEMPIVGDVLPQIISAEEQTLQAWVRDAQRLGARQVTSQFLCGAAWDEIVNFARRDSTIDLIVMGTHGRTGLRHMLIGSVAEKVVRHAPCRVLVTREREEQPVCAQHRPQRGRGSGTRREQTDDMIGELGPPADRTGPA
jgi:nucleotide-binding universal stress UspA family protein